MKRICIVIFLILTCFNQLFAPNLTNTQEEQKNTNKERIVRLDELMTAEFSVDNLKELLILLNAPDPEIILNQAKLETGWFKSRLFVYHNNLFGMHFPRHRETYSDRYTIADNGSKCASYGSWQSSVLDLLLYFEYYESRGYDTKDYYGFLVDVGYCEKNIYVNILKRMS
jgi:hypothetical protein